MDAKIHRPDVTIMKVGGKSPVIADSAFIDPVDTSSNSPPPTNNSTAAISQLCTLSALSGAPKNTSSEPWEELSCRW